MKPPFKSKLLLWVVTAILPAAVLVLGGTNQLRASETSTGFSENFDGVVAPSLPAGWVAVNTLGSSPLWVTSTANPNSAPNAASIDDASFTSDKRLDTPNLFVMSPSAQLSFRNNFLTEMSGGVFWDGGVLEVSSPNINGGAFTDVTSLAVGGSFAAGGYTGMINSTGGNPLAGRMAWSGDSGGYITTVVNLGPNVNGQRIKLRFRMGTDSVRGAPGWRIDSLVGTGLVLVSPITMTTGVSRKIHGSTGTFDVNLPLSGTPGVECRAGGGGGTHTLVFTFSNNVVSGNATVTSGTGSVAGAPAFSGNTMTVNLTGVANAQTVTVTLTNVTDVFTQVLANSSVGVSFLLGDTNGDTFVNVGDSGQTRNRSGQVAAATNFRSDLNADGLVNSGDTTSVRSRSGTSLPPATNCTENFDGVTAPTLPAGWVATNIVGTGVLFVTSTVTPDSPPNSAFIPDSTTTSLKVLETPSYTINSATAQLTFRNSYDFETSDADYDGSVLEVSSPNIAGGDYIDITDPAVGASFVTGGYNVTLVEELNPLGGRQAWGRNSGGYITTTVNLGANLNGQTIKFRFGAGTDSNTAAPNGWHIDTLSLTGGTCP